MGKCAAYWRARDNGKDCGVPEGKGTLKQQDIYRKEIVADLVSMGAVEDDVFELLSYSTCFNKNSGSPVRNYKIINFGSLRRDSPLRKKALDFVFGRIMSGKRTTTRDFAEAGFTRDSWTVEDYRRHYTALPASKALHSDNLSLPPRENISERGINKAIGNLKNNPVPSDSTKTVDGIGTTITTKKRNLSGFCTAGQYGILQRLVDSGYADDEYAAFCISLVWAAERVEAEKAAKGATN